MKKPYLIIGGSGFIGSSICKKLKSNEFDILDIKTSSISSDISTFIVDIRDKIKIEDYIKGYKCIILLAAEHKDNISPKSLYYDVNVEGTKNVLDAMRKNNIPRLIFTSSVAVYGMNINDADESSKTNPFNDYGKSKLIAETEIVKWQREASKNRSALIIRPTVVFGENNRGNVYNLFNQINKNMFFMIGKGNNKKSIAYVDNLSDFIILKLNNFKNIVDIYNYSDKPDFTMKELIELIFKSLNIKENKLIIPLFMAKAVAIILDLISLVTKIKFPISLIRIKKFTSDSIINSKKLHKIFKPKYSIEKAIKKTIYYEFK